MPQDALDAQFDRLRQDLRQDIQASADRLRQDFRQEIQATAAELRREFREDIQASAAETRQEFRQDIQASAANLRQEIQASAVELRQDFRQEIQASAAETRRHMDMVAEGLRSAIRVIAERLCALDEKVERFRDEVHQEFGKVDRRFLRLEERIVLWSAARAPGPLPEAPRQPGTCRSPRRLPERARCWPSGRCRSGTICGTP